ncbi:MAG: ATP-binding cassette domain-containing protein [Promethearchaeota archaeon]
MNALEKLTDTSIIKAENLGRDYRVRAPHPSGKRTLRRYHKTITALDNINFVIESGTLTGLVGLNGAGKSTLIKLMTGILSPTRGKIHVMGFDPIKQRKRAVKNFGVVFGQRSLLWFHLSVKRSFQLYKEIYKIPNQVYKDNLEVFSDLLSLNEIINQPVRTLSLGQRMRCELTAALLHDPPLIILDEPEVGLDFIAKNNLRKFLQLINKEKGTTILISNHDIIGIDRLAPQLLLLHQGRLIYDGQTQKFLKEKTHMLRALQISLERTPEKKIHEIQKLDPVLLTTDPSTIQIVYSTSKNTAMDFTSLFSNPEYLVRSPNLEELLQLFYKDEDDSS